MIVARSHQNTTPNPLSLLMYFLLFFFLCNPLVPRCPVPACRHHGSALSDRLHANGCGDYARHFRFCAPDRSVFFCVFVWGFLVVHQSIQIVCTLMSEMCSPPGCLRAVLCQHHGDCRDVGRGHGHRPAVPSSQPQQWTHATLGEF